jgi:hypothetical protein
MSRNYGYHLREVVSEAHRAVTELPEQDTEDGTEQSTQQRTADGTALRISELVEE